MWGAGRDTDAAAQRIAGIAIIVQKTRREARIGDVAIRKMRGCAAAVGLQNAIAIGRIWLIAGITGKPAIRRRAGRGSIRDGRAGRIGQTLGVIARGVVARVATQSAVWRRSAEITVGYRRA